MRCTGKIKINQIPLGIWFIFNNHKLDSAGNFTGTQATSANGFQARLVCLLEWLTLLPARVPLPQTSQMDAMSPTSLTYYEH